MQTRGSEATRAETRNRRFLLVPVYATIIETVMGIPLLKKSSD